MQLLKEAGGRGGFSNFDFSNIFSDIFGSDPFDDLFEGFWEDQEEEEDPPTLEVQI